MDKEIKKYNHLTEKDRIFLRVMLERHYSKNKIAEILGVHRSTIYRELRRNSFKHWRYDINIYFCKPASPYQKGAVENGNGVIRAELPRNYDIAKLKQKHISRLIDEINNRPLKCLGYKTPLEIFQQFIIK